MKPIQKFCHQLSNFTLTISRYTIRDLEKLKGKHLYSMTGQKVCNFHLIADSY